MFEDPKSTWRTRVVCSSPKVYSEWCWIMGEQKAKLILKQYGRNPRHVPTKLSHPAHSQGFSFDRTFTCLAWSWPKIIFDAIRIQGFRPCQTLTQTHVGVDIFTQQFLEYIGSYELACWLLTYKKNNYIWAILTCIQTIFTQLRNIRASNVSVIFSCLFSKTSSTCAATREMFIA